MMVGVDKGGPAIADLGVGRNRRGGSLEQLRRRSGRVAELVLLVAVRQGIAPADLLNKSRGEYAYTLIDTDTAVSEGVLKQIRGISGVLSARIV